ncbi:DUF1697 domain-containing protein [Glycomyces halotolerans]
MVAMLRGVNVSGKNKLPMSEFRSVLGELGFANVATYIQSGNAVFDSDLSSAQVAETVRTALADRFDIETPVIVRTAEELEAILAADPFAGRDLDPSKVIVSLLADPAPETLSVPDGRPEEAHTLGREVWVYYPTGIGKSKLDRTPFWKPLGKAAVTARNLRTVQKLRDMARQ